MEVKAIVCAEGSLRLCPHVHLRVHVFVMLSRQTHFDALWRRSCTKKVETRKDFAA